MSIEAGKKFGPFYGVIHLGIEHVGDFMNPGKPIIGIHQVGDGLGLLRNDLFQLCPYGIPYVGQLRGRTFLPGLKVLSLPCFAFMG